MESTYPNAAVEEFKESIKKSKELGFSVNEILFPDEDSLLKGSPVVVSVIKWWDEFE